MKVIERIRSRVTDMFRFRLADAVKRNFEIEVETSFSIIELTNVTTRVDEKEFTPEQMAFIKAYAAGYFDCIDEAGNYERPMRTG